jgi:hypothetical protein
MQKSTETTRGAYAIGALLPAQVAEIPDEIKDTEISKILFR